MSKWRIGALSVVLCVAAASRASALEVGEVINMLKNGVHESVVINMVQQQKLSRPLTAQEVIDLSRSGVSPQIMTALTDAANVGPMYAPSGSTVAVPVENYTASMPGACGVAPTAPAPVVVEQPATVVTAPPTVYYTYPDSYYYYGYPYYNYPYRYGPSYSFSFGYGHRWGGHRGGHRGGPRSGPPRGRR